MSIQPKEKNKKIKSFLARESEIRHAYYTNRLIFVLICKGAYLTTNDLSVFVYLL